MRGNTSIRLQLQKVSTAIDTDLIRIDYIDYEKVLQSNDDCMLVEFEDGIANITPRLQVETAKADADKVSNAVLRIGYSTDIEASFEQVQSVLRVINDAISNVNLIWGYGVDDKLPDGHCSILLLVG